MTRLAPITYTLEDIEINEVPGVMLSNVSCEIAITGYSPDYEWYLDEVSVGWEHLNQWKTYHKGEFLFTVIDQYLKKYCDDDIYDRCAEAARGDDW